jgi:hypothetical protein
MSELRARLAGGPSRQLALASPAGVFDVGGELSAEAVAFFVFGSIS